VDAAVTFMVELVLGILMTALGLWALFTYLEPCAAGTLCSVVPVTALRRVRAGAPPAPEGDTSAHQLGNQINTAVRAAYAAGQADGEHSGYISGMRAGRLAAFVAGLLIGALALFASLQAGLQVG